MFHTQEHERRNERSSLQQQEPMNHPQLSLPKAAGRIDDKPEERTAHDSRKVSAHHIPHHLELSEQRCLKGIIPKILSTKVIIPCACKRMNHEGFQVEENVVESLVPDLQPAGKPAGIAHQGGITEQVLQYNSNHQQQEQPRGHPFRTS